MNSETDDILKRIEIAVKLGQDKISFQKSELDSNSALLSAINWLEGLKIILGGLIVSSSSGRSVDDIPYYPVYDPPPTIMSENDEYSREWVERNNRRIQTEFDKLGSRVNFKIDKEKFQKIFKTSNPIPKEGTLISRDGSGEFFYNNKPLGLRSKQKTIYYLLLLALYSKSDPNGFCSYKIIDDFFIENGKDEITGTENQIKRISNALSRIRHCITKLPEKALDDQDIILVRNGDGLLFYNPQIT